ncbi:MAG: type IV secretory system conjugative DNA transfer family protein [Candidatus Dormibacteraeota bacterium]|nr:type IV secretory system conjugative DNA transfer family protein [Candidatus Dormibacteraeota bacterium]
MRVSRERKPKGTRRRLPLAEAVAAGGAASWLSWTAPAPARGGLGLMLLAGTLAVSAGLMVRGWWARRPFDLPAPYWRMTTLARWCWREQLFLGWASPFRWVFAGSEDSSGTVGPPRVNKTGGLGVAQILLWGGSLVSVAPKPEMLRLTVRRRQRLARRFGGKILVYAPHERGLVEGVRGIRFSPSSSTDPTEIGLRVESWMAASRTAQGVSDHEHFRAGAGALLRGCFLASAHHPSRPGDFRLVRRWLATRNLAEPIGILRSLNSELGDQWAEELEGIQNSPAEKEREGFFSAALTTISATSNPNVLGSTARTDLDFEAFLRSRSTLYIPIETEHQRAVAPLISMLIDTLVRTAYRMHREGRLPARLLLSLDDMANCAPLPGLESVISQGGGQGVNVAWSLQSLAQLREHWGVEAAEAIWSATRAKEIFGGLGDEQGLEKISSAIGDERVITPGESSTNDGPRGSKHVSWRRVLAPSQLREIPNRWVVLLYLNRPAAAVRVPLAVKTFLRHEMRLWTPAQAHPLHVMGNEDEEEVA